MNTTQTSLKGMTEDYSPAPARCIKCNAQDVEGRAKGKMWTCDSCILAGNFGKKGSEA